MSRRAIDTCNDIEILRRLCLEYRSQYGVISEILVDESKMNISAEKAVTDMREYLYQNQYKVDFDYVSEHLEELNIEDKRIREEIRKI